MQYRKTSKMSWQEMAKWKCYLSRVLFSDKGFTGDKFIHPNFLEIYRLSQLGWIIKLSQALLLYLNKEMDLLHFVIFAMGDKLPTDFVLLQKTNCPLFKTFYSLIIQQVWRLAFRSQKLLAVIYSPWFQSN